MRRCDGQRPTANGHGHDEKVNGTDGPQHAARPLAARRAGNTGSPGVPRPRPRSGPLRGAEAGEEGPWRTNGLPPPSSAAEIVRPAQTSCVWRGVTMAGAPASRPRRPRPPATRGRRSQGPFAPCASTSVAPSGAPVTVCPFSTMQRLFFGLFTTRPFDALSTAPRFRLSAGAPRPALRVAARQEIRHRGQHARPTARRCHQMPAAALSRPKRRAEARQVALPRSVSQAVFRLHVCNSLWRSTLRRLRDTSVSFFVLQRSRCTRPPLRCGA